MKKDILYFQWICILMLVSGLLWVAAGSLPLFLWEEEIAEGLVESRIIGFFMMAQAVFSVVCCFAGMQAVRKKERFHLCIMLGTGALAGALINDVFYVSMEILLWQMAAGAATGTAAAVLYLGGAVIMECTEGKGLSKKNK